MLFLWVRLFNLFDWLRNIFFYYLLNPKFALVDTNLLLSYFFKSPYSIARNAYPESGPYGETPFREMDTILKLTYLKASSKVLDIGCGRGRLAFWLQMVKGFDVTGMDINSLFIKRAQKIAHRWNVPATFKEQSCFEIKDFSFDLIYFFILHLSDDELHHFGKRMIRSQTKAYIVTVSFWFGEYLPEQFELVATCNLRFVWGETVGYIQRLKTVK